VQLCLTVVNSLWYYITTETSRNWLLSGFLAYKIIRGHGYLTHVTARGSTRNNGNRDPRTVGMATLHVMGRYFWHPIWETVTQWRGERKEGKHILINNIPKKKSENFFVFVTKPHWINCISHILSNEMHGWLRIVTKHTSGGAEKTREKPVRTPWVWTEIWTLDRMNENKVCNYCTVKLGECEVN